LAEVERTARINAHLEQLDANVVISADAMAIYADTVQAMREAELARMAETDATWADLQRGAVAAAGALATVGRVYSLDPGASANVPTRDLVPPAVAAIVPAAVDLTTALEGITADLGSITEGSVNQLRGRIQALQAEADNATSSVVRAALVALVQSLEGELADLIRRSTPVAILAMPSVTLNPLSLDQREFNDNYQGFRNRDLDRGDGGLGAAGHVNLLEQENAARAALVKQLTNVSSDKGPLANFGAALFGLAAEKIPIVGAALEGFAQGGPMGAVAAVFTQLLSESEAFASFLEAVNSALAPLIELIGNVMTPVFTVVAAVLKGVVVAVVAVWNFLLGWIPGMRVEGKAAAETPEHSSDAPGMREVSFGGVSPAVQYAVATPLLEAAQLQLSSAQLLDATFSRADAMYSRVERFYDRVLSEGFRVSSAPSSSSSRVGGAAFSRSAIVRG
jgi:hypothetical protein